MKQKQVKQVKKNVNSSSSVKLSPGKNFQITENKPCNHNSKLYVNEDMNSDNNSILPWFADIDVVRRFIETLQYLQQTAITVHRVATSCPYETSDKMYHILAQALDGALTPLSPTVRQSMIRHTSIIYRNQRLVDGVVLNNGFTLGMQVPLNTEDPFFQSPLGNLLERIFSPYTRDMVSGSVALDVLMYVADRTGVNLNGQNQSLPAQVIERVLQIIARAVGVHLSHDDSNRHRSESFLKENARTIFHIKNTKRERGHAALVMSYKERDEVQISKKQSRRMTKMMHNIISIKPFDAEVLIPSTLARDNFNEALREVLTWEDFTGAPESYSPQSFPPSPAARSSLLSTFSAFTDEVLYRARDELRSEEAETPVVKLAVFNPSDAHEDIKLSCGNHCAAKVGDGLYRSVRSAATIPMGGVPVYFEMHIQPNIATTSTASANRRIRKRDTASSICIGVASSELKLNSHVGSDDSSIGLCSSGHVIICGQWIALHNTNVNRFKSGDNIGCLVVVDSNEYCDTPASNHYYSSDPYNETPFYLNDEDCSEFSGDFPPPTLYDEQKSPVEFAAPEQYIMKVWFFLNGKILHGELDDHNYDISPQQSIATSTTANSTYKLPTPFSVKVSRKECLHPALSLYSKDVKVMSHFAAADIVHNDVVLDYFPTAIALDGCLLATRT